jgi:signal transduction histidine kinase
VLKHKAHRLSEPERQRYLDTALAQSSKVATLAQQLFELARLECGGVEPERERFSLAELVQDVFQKFELAARQRNLELVAHVAPGTPAVSADLAMIERVLTNLLDNAIANTPEGGEVRVDLGHRGGQVEVEVSDTGPGIPGPLRGELFKRSSALARAALDRGSGGLGLMVVHSILRLHGSEITLVEKAERGAAFRFALGTA